MINNPTKKITDKEQILCYLPLNEPCEIKSEYFEYNPYCMIRTGKEKAILTHDVDNLKVKQCNKDNATIATVSIGESVKDMLLECSGCRRDLWINYESGNQVHVIIYRRL